MIYEDEITADRFKYTVGSYEDFEKELMDQHPTTGVLKMILKQIDAKVKELKTNRKSKYIILKKELFKDTNWYQKHFNYIKIDGIDEEKRRTTYYIDYSDDDCIKFKYYEWTFGSDYLHISKISEASYDCLIKTMMKKIKRNDYVSKNLDRITMIQQIYDLQKELNNLL